MKKREVLTIAPKAFMKKCEVFMEKRGVLEHQKDDFRKPTVDKIAGIEDFGTYAHRLPGERHAPFKTDEMGC